MSIWYLETFGLRFFWTGLFMIIYGGGRSTYDLYCKHRKHDIDMQAQTDGEIIIGHVLTAAVTTLLVTVFPVIRP